MSSPTVRALLEDLAADEGALRELEDLLREVRSNDANRLLDARQMAGLLGLHPDTLARTARCGTIWARRLGENGAFAPIALRFAPPGARRSCRRRRPHRSAPTQK